MDTEQRPRARWHFSLRELLLAMLTIAALLGWGLTLYRKSRVHITGVYGSDDGIDLLETLKQIDHAQYPLQEEGFGREGKWSAYRVERYRIKLPPADSDTFMTAFQRRIREKIASSQCRLDNEQKGYGPNNEQWFWTDYSRNSTTGYARVDLLRYGDDQVRLSIFVYEVRIK